MPSPLGHALASVAVGWAIARPAGGRALLVQTTAFALLGTAPDLDLLWDRHRAETHSLGAAVIVATVAAWRMWPLADTRLRIWLAAFAAWAAHPLTDSLALDNGPPAGVMAFWPISTAYVQTGLSVFAPITRSFDRPGVVIHNLLAVVRELVLLVPIVGAIWMWRGRTGQSG
jgi:membrane-bound metal-dependent hydrolase YbcI (DUF457 family)